MDGDYNGELLGRPGVPRRLPRGLRRGRPGSRPSTSRRRAGASTLFQGSSTTRSTSRQGRRRGSSPWLLDEPAHFQDFGALRYFGEAFHEGVRQAGGEAPHGWSSAPTSRAPSGSATSARRRARLSRGGLGVPAVPAAGPRPSADFGEIVVEYGSANAVGEANIQAVAWCLDAWSLGADGVLPWQTIGTGDSWGKADGWRSCTPRPGPTVRPHPLDPPEGVPPRPAGRRIPGAPRAPAGVPGGPSERPSARPSSRRRPPGHTGVGIEDAGVLDYGALRPEDFAALRARVVRALVESPPVSSPDAPSLSNPRSRPEGPQAVATCRSTRRRRSDDRESLVPDLPRPRVSATRTHSPCVNRPPRPIICINSDVFTCGFPRRICSRRRPRSVDSPSPSASTPRRPGARCGRSGGSSATTSRTTRT